MKANIKPGYDNKRHILKDVVLLDTPYTLFISPSQLCNFKCDYCAHSLPTEKKKAGGLVTKHMSNSLFEKILEQTKKFPNKFKRILLTGLGEPMMNPNIVNMVKELQIANVSENLEIFTNGSYLTKENTDGLINAGLTKLRISIQGTDEQQYKKNCGININFDKLVEDIAYFYKKSRDKCTLYIKIIDEELKDENDKKKFFSIFGSICDEIYVENLVRAQPMMGDYDNTITIGKTFYGEVAEKREVCPYIFYTLQIDSEGNCFPCPPLSLPKNFSIGNVEKEELIEIWNGKIHKELMLSHLRMDGSKCDLCKKCISYLCFTPKEDNLDNDAEQIIQKIEELN